MLFDEEPAPINSLLARYRSTVAEGGGAAVWADLLALGPIPGKLVAHRDAMAVADETMRRVRANLQTLHDHLQTAGYLFENPSGALAPPLPDVDARIACAESQFGPMPLSFKAFCRIVGSVDFRQSSRQLVQHRQPQRKNAIELFILGEEDPLQVFPLDEMLDDDDRPTPDRLCFAADEFHKANYGGGENYHVTLGNPHADFQIEGMYGIDEHFVDYLRRSLVHGGFRGRLVTDGENPERVLKPPPSLQLCKQLADGLLPI